MVKTIQFLVIVLSLLARGTIGGSRRSCPHIPSLTAEQACEAVCGTRHMHELCLRTLLRRGHGHGGGPAAVTYHAGVAARSALDSYAATAAANQAKVYGGAVPRDEQVAHAGCMHGYGASRRSMSRIAAGLASCDGAVYLRLEYMESLRGMDACRKSLLKYPASPLYGMNLADRNKTLLAALLCSLVPTPPEGRRGGMAHE